MNLFAVRAGHRGDMTASIYGSLRLGDDDTQGLHRGGDGRLFSRQQMRERREEGEQYNVGEEEEMKELLS